MSVYDKASLVLIPSGTKTSKVYSQKPVNGDGDFTFSRSTAATRVNADGNIEKETQNLLRYSNVFDNVNWNKIDTTITSGQTGFDGSSNAWLLTKTAANGNIYQSQGYSGVQTLSFYVKANTTDWVRLRSGGGYVYFDVANGNIGIRTNDIDSSITFVANGWYRIEVVWSGSNGISQLFVADGDGVTSGTSGSVYIQYPQLEDGLVARKYLDATTAAVEGGITDNVPRLDYTDSSCPALLLEPQRSNLCIQSEYAGSWSTSGVGSVTDNAEISPEGVQNAFTLNDTSSGAYFRIERNVSVSAGDNTLSVFLKKTTGALSHYAGVQFDISRKYVIIDTTNGTWNEAGSGDNDFIDVEDFSADYWRVIIRNNLSAGSKRVGLWPALSTNGSDIAVGATGENTFYGAQVEAGSYATSYIPTYGTSVTRSQDLNLTASPSTSYFGQTEGTIFTEIKINAITSGSYSRVFNLKNSGGSNQIYFQQNDSRINGVVFNGSNQFTKSTSSGFLSVGSTYKMAMAYKDGDYALYINGTQIGTSSASGLGTLAVDRVDFTTLSGNINLGNEVKQSLVFNTRLSNEELAALTTI